MDVSPLERPSTAIPLYCEAGPVKERIVRAHVPRQANSLRITLGPDDTRREQSGRC